MTSNNLIVNVLKECNTELMSNLSPDSAVNYFWTRNLLTDYERDHIRITGRTRTGQNGEFLDILRTKSNFLLEELIEYLMLDKSKDFLVTLLQESISKHIGDVKPVGNVTKLDEGDFKITYRRAAKVTHILMEDPDILRDWGTMIVHLFLDKAIDLYEIDKTDHPHQKIMLTLNKWISKSGNSTFDSLIKLLGEYKQAVGNLRKKKDMIRDSDTS